MLSPGREVVVVVVGDEFELCWDRPGFDIVAAHESPS